ncbi:MAG: hypothetical protein HUK22_07180, partial [Thermoguttaceae bacterium]|nr:hypothetical protein [Thermoguttaceae bacterium]
LAVSAPSGITFAYESRGAGAWTVVETGRGDDGRESFARLDAEGRESSASFGARLETSENSGDTVVDRAWIQTWALGSSRVDRAAYRLRTERDRVKIKLPPGVLRERVAVVVDGKPLSNVGNPERGFFDQNGDLEIPAPDETRRRDFTLELDYAIDGVDWSRSEWDVEFPQIMDASTWVRRAYWQIITPRNRHIAFDPDAWTPEYVLKRGRYGAFGREASIPQEGLCDWVGVKRRESVPPEANVYLFSSFTAPQRARFYVVDRAWTILIGSGATLLFGLGLMYCPALRRRGVLFAAAVITLTLATFRPLMAVLFLQTTIFGAFLALCAALAAKFLARHETRVVEKRKNRATETALNGAEGK